MHRIQNYDTGLSWLEKLREVCYVHSQVDMMYATTSKFQCIITGEMLVINVCTPTREPGDTELLSQM